MYRPLQLSSEITGGNTTLRRKNKWIQTQEGERVRGGESDTRYVVSFAMSIPSNAQLE